MTRSPTPTLVDALARIAREGGVGRKLVVAPTFGGGRELLRALARKGQGWVGFEVTTPRPLALQLARPSLAADGLLLLDAFDEQALLDEAMDGAVLRGGDGTLAELAEGVGFREAVHGAVEALRLGEVTPGRLRHARFGDPAKQAFVARVLERYETLLRERRRGDTATVLTHALRALDQEGVGLPDALAADAVYLVPGLGIRGLMGRFLHALHQRGAQVLSTDAVVGRDVPKGILWREGDARAPFSCLYDPEAASAAGANPDLFHAGSITDELREVFRRIVASGLSWDQVEIVAPDAAAYGSALHALAVRMGVPVTYAVGLPVGRTRPGRVVQAYLEWIQGGFQAHVIRRLLEAGDLRPPRTPLYHGPGDLARRFRALRIGWGRRRYRTQIRGALEALEAADPGRREPPEVFQRRVRRERGELEALRSILFPALKATPSVPDRMGEGGEPVSPAELARGLRAFLRKVPKGKGADVEVRDRVLAVLDRVEATLRRRTHFDSAAAILRGHLEQVRVPGPGGGGVDERGAPWSSEGGHLHLADVEHGGYTGRPAVFVVGMDADRVPGTGGQDPVLTDADRRALGGALPSSSDQMQERAFRLAALLARLRGSVTLSHAAWSASEGRTVAPSPVLLQCLRLARRDATLTFEDLAEALGGVVGAVPRGSPALDADDVWMQALDDGAVLKSGMDVVRAAFPDLDRGHQALQEREEGVPGPHHGVVTPRPDLFDPRGRGDAVLSASRLQDLGACPLRYLLRAVLHVHPPDDPELDPDRWLDALQKGNLLHWVYERTLRRAKDRGLLDRNGSLEPLALEVLDEAVEHWKTQVPAPGEGAVNREVGALEEDVRAFARMVREHGAPWTRLEMKFGMDGAEALVVEVEGGAIRVRGAVDRVDEDLAGLHVIDYKTGLPREYEGRTGVFHGGRRLQHALYALAAEAALGRDVVEAAYHFPTRRGENEIRGYARLELAGLPTLLGHLLDSVAAGTFVPTDSADDCRFCDFASVCRARTLEWGKTESPPAAWSAQQVALGLHPEIGHLRAARRFEE